MKIVRTITKANRKNESLVKKLNERVIEVMEDFTRGLLLIAGKLKLTRRAPQGPSFPEPVEGYFRKRSIRVEHNNGRSIKLLKLLTIIFLLVSIAFLPSCLVFVHHPEGGRGYEHHEEHHEEHHGHEGHHD